MITSVGTVAVVVRDGNVAVDWYQDKLGFEVRSKDGHWVTVAPCSRTSTEMFSGL